MRFPYFMLFYLVFVSCGSTPPMRVQRFPSQPPHRQPPKAVEKTNGLVSIEDYRPWFADGEAALALKEDRLPEAMALFDEIAENTSDIELTPRARFMAAYLAGRLGDNARAFEALPKLAEELPLVADLALEQAARAALDLKKYDEAIALSARVDEESTLKPDAAMVHADALRLKGETRGAVEAYQRFLDQWPSSRSRQEAKSRIVECMACMDLKDDEAKAALSLIADLRAQSPYGYWTDRAEKHEAAFLSVLGLEAPKARPVRRAAEKAYDEASTLRRKMKNERAEKAYDQVIRLARKGGKLRCKARFEQAIVVANQRDFGRAADLFRGVADDCSDPNLRIRSLYRGGKAFFSADRTEDAIAMFGRVESEFPKHSFADDARLRAAKCYQSTGNREKFAELLASLPELYPTGDMRAEAL